MSERVEPILQELSGPIEHLGNTYRATGFIRDDWYHLSYHSMVVPTTRPLFWRGHQLSWRGNGLSVESGNYRTHRQEELHFNRTLIYDIDRNRWWQDSFGVLSVTRAGDTHFGVVPYYVDGETKFRLCTLYAGPEDFDGDIHWRWESNEIRLPKETLIHSAFVGVKGDAHLDLSVTMEQGTEQQSIYCNDAFDFHAQEVGFWLNGRTVQVSLSSSDRAKVDRIELNPEPHTY